MYFNECLLRVALYTIGSVSRTIKATGLSRAKVVRIVHDKKRLAESEEFPFNETLSWLPKAQHYLLTRSSMDLTRPCESLACETTIKALALLPCQISFTRQYNRDVTL